MKIKMWRALVLVAIAAVACADGPTQPGIVPVIDGSPTLAGQWRGLFETTHCAGPGSACTGATIGEFQLVAVPAAAGVEGVLVLHDDDRTTVTIASAALDGNGTMTARGFDEPTTDTWPVRTTVAAVELRLDATVGLTGSITYTNTTFRSVTRTVALRSAVAMSAADSPGNFHGTWDGYWRTRACDGDCMVGSGGYNARGGGHLTMAVAQAGGEMVGSVMSHLVRGSAHASILSATGPGLTADLCETCWDCEGVCQTAVRNVDTSVDKLGRLNGTFEYHEKGWTGRVHFRRTLLVELVSVTRRW